MLVDFQNSFPIEFAKEFAINLSFSPPHLNYEQKISLVFFDSQCTRYTANRHEWSYVNQNAINGH